MASMNLKQIIVDSLRYSASDFKIVVILGIVLLLADIAYDLSDRGELASELRLILPYSVLSSYQFLKQDMYLEFSKNRSMGHQDFQNLII